MKHKLEIEMIMGIVLVVLGYVFTNNPYIAISVGILLIVIFYLLNKRIELIDKKQNEFIERWKNFKEKHGSELDGLEMPNYIGYITSEYSKTDIELLFKTHLLSKSQYESYKTLSGLL